MTTPFPFEVSVTAEPSPVLTVASAGGPPTSYRLESQGQTAWLDLFEALARDHGLRRPLARIAPTTPPSKSRLAPVLTAPISPRILYGYGDPCVVRVGPGDYRLLVTSNDAPDAFPILASSDLVDWRLTGFVFPQGGAPTWALTGPDVSDFWAPEMHRVGDAWWVCFTAREKDGGLAIGLARSASPDGPFIPEAEPIVRGGVIDAHIVTDEAGDAFLVWKKDDNDVWPSRLGGLLHGQPELISALFGDEVDQRTAAFVAALWPWIAGLPPMERFFALQLLIEAAADDLTAFETRLNGVRGRAPVEVDAILEALRTRIMIQPLSLQGALTGEPRTILCNDLAWEGHLIEGVWITRAEGRYYLLYAGNDFSTARYGIGAAVAASPQGPYVKLPEPFLASDGDWWGPGHPSVVIDDNGRHHIFLHAFHPGRAGYKAFRALLTAPVCLSDGGITLG